MIQRMKEDKIALSVFLELAFVHTGKGTYGVLARRFGYTNPSWYSTTPRHRIQEWFLSAIGGQKNLEETAGVISMFSGITISLSKACSRFEDLNPDGHEFECANCGWSDYYHHRNGSPRKCKLCGSGAFNSLKFGEKLLAAIDENNQATEVIQDVLIQGLAEQLGQRYPGTLAGFQRFQPGRVYTSLWACKRAFVKYHGP